MEYKNFIIGIFLIVVPLILLILCYRNYVYEYCKNDIICMKDRLLLNLNNVNTKLKYNIEKNNNLLLSEQEQEKYENQYQEDEIEGFFGGFANWFSGGTPSNLPTATPGSFPSENLNSLEKKISDRMIPSSKFPPSESNDEFKDSDNNEVLKISGSKHYNPVLSNEKKQIVQPNNENKNPEAVFDSKKLENPKIDINSLIKKSENILSNKPQEKIEIKKEPSSDMKSLFGNCQFFNDKCPDKYHPLGNFSIQGVGGNLSCGNVQNTKPARAIAEIKNNSIYEIHITDQGHGFNPKSPPKVSIEGGKGHGANAEAIVDDDGFLKIIKVINPGYNYSETPNVMIDAPFMNSSCHLCCSDEPLKNN